MLTKIMQALRNAEEPLELTKLAAQLDIEVSALDGMLDQLVKQGKLRKVEEMTAKECQMAYESGAYGNLCAFLTKGNTAIRYDIVEP